MPRWRCPSGCPPGGGSSCNNKPELSSPRPLLWRWPCVAGPGGRIDCSSNRFSDHLPAAHACRACVYAGHSDLRGRTIPAIRCLNAVVTSDSAVRSRIQEFGSGSFRRDQQTPEAIAAIEKAGVEEWVADHESGRKQSGAKRVGKKFGDRQRVGRFSN
jgi:hypothetical protein